MADKAQTTDAEPGSDETPPIPPPSTPPAPPKRSPGHRGADVRDTVAEMTAKAHEISLEAGSKMAGAMKDVINAAAGLAGFAIESARDLVQYMVRRGQMTQDEADKLLREAEEAQARRKPPVTPPDESEAKPAAKKKAAVKAPETEAAPATEPKKVSAKAAKSAATKTPAEKPTAAKSSAAKKAPPAKPPAKPQPKKPAKKK